MISDVDPKLRVATNPDINAEIKQVTKIKEKTPPLEFIAHSFKPICLSPYHIKMPPTTARVGIKPNRAISFSGESEFMPNKNFGRLNPRISATK